VLRLLLEVISSFALVLLSVMPETSLELLKNLGYEGEKSLAKAFEFKKLSEGQTVKKGKPLYPRIDPKEYEKVSSKKSSTSESKESYISIEDFSRVELKVGKVTFAEKIPNTDKLLRLEVECPEKRQLVSGIAQYYDPKELVGKEVIVVTNLKPAKIRGVLSEGMILAAKDGSKLVLITPEKEVTPGSKVG